MPQLDLDGANSKISADKIQGQSGTTVTVPTGHTVAITDSGGLTLAGTAVNAGSLGVAGITSSANATAISIDANEIVTMPKQPMVLSQLDATQSNVTGNDNTYNITGITWNDVLDYNADFSNGTFTAPVTGAYLINCIIQRSGLASSHTTGSTALIASNRTIRLGYVSSYATGAGGANYTGNWSTIIDMDASDTCYIQLEDAASSQTIDINNNTYFSATLLG